MQSTDADFYRSLDLEQYQVLADALGNTQETVGSVHLLRRGLCKAYVAGEPSQYYGAIVQANDFPTEPTGFGSEPRVLWELLRLVKGWDCILVDLECAAALGEIIEREMSVRVRYLDDVYHTLLEPAAVFYDESVRQLTLGDLELLESAPPELRASLWGGSRVLLSEGVVACGILFGRVVATALTAACSGGYADVGVHTSEGFRGRGLATAAASLVAKRVQESGQVPVWSAGGHNVASLGVARKLGFVEVSRRRYIIPDRIERIAKSVEESTVYV